jgi:CBS domain-containing protein
MVPSKTTARKGLFFMMTCSDVMTKDPACCVPTDSASRVAKIMKTENVGSIPVCESRQSRRLIGIVTDRDLALHVVAEGRDATGTLVQDVMSKEPISCSPQDNLQMALDAMQSHQVRRIPVVDRGGQLIGIIAQADIATRYDDPKKTAETLEEISRPSTAHA